MTRIPGAFRPLAVIVLSLAWPSAADSRIGGNGTLFGPETGPAGLSVHHCVMIGGLLLVWLISSRDRTAGALAGLAALVVLASAVLKVPAQPALTLLWSLTALTATALAGLTDPADLARLFGPPPVRAFKNAVLFLTAVGLTFTVYHLFGLLGPGAAADGALPGHIRLSGLPGLTREYAWAYAAGPWALVIIMLWFSGPRPGLALVPALGTAMLLSLGLWIKFQLGGGWSGGWLAVWCDLAGTLALVLAWAATAAALLSLARRRLEDRAERAAEHSGENPAEPYEHHRRLAGERAAEQFGENPAEAYEHHRRLAGERAAEHFGQDPAEPYENHRRLAGLKNFRPWISLGVCVLLGAAATAVFLAAISLR